MPNARVSLADRLRMGLRRLVIATSVPPLNWLYLAIYRLLARWVARLLARVPGVETVYLRRGLAKGAVTPGISDIDLGVVGDVDPQLRYDFHWLPAMLVNLGLLDSAPERHPTQEPLTWFWLRTSNQFRLSEGKRTWRRMSGPDWLGQLPTLAGEELAAPAFAEMTFWWGRFCRDVMGPRPVTRDAISRRAGFYKTVAEALHAAHVVRTGEVSFRRDTSLELVQPLLTPEEGETLDRLVRLRRARFLREDPGLDAAVCTLLLDFTDRLVDDLGEHAMLRPCGSLETRIDCPPEELWPCPAMRQQADATLAAADRLWRQRPVGAYVTTGGFSQPQERLLLLQVDPGEPPSLEELAALAATLPALQFAEQEALEVHVLLRHAAMRVSDTRGSTVWQPILIPGGAPDAFALLDRPAHVLRDGGWRCPPPPMLTEATSYFTWSLGLDMRDRIMIPPRAEQNGRRFVMECFWLAKLIAQARLMRQGELRYAPTIPAAQRLMADAGLDLPPPLDELAELLRAAMRGEQTDAAPLIAPARAWVAALEARGEAFPRPTGPDWRPHLACLWR